MDFESRKIVQDMINTCLENGADAWAQMFLPLLGRNSFDKDEYEILIKYHFSRGDWEKAKICAKAIKRKICRSEREAVFQYILNRGNFTNHDCDILLKIASEGISPCLTDELVKAAVDGKILKCALQAARLNATQEAVDLLIQARIDDCRDRKDPTADFSEFIELAQSGASSAQKIRLLDYFIEIMDVHRARFAAEKLFGRELDIKEILKLKAIIRSHYPPPPQKT